MTLPGTEAFRQALPSEGRLVLTTHRHPDPDGLGALVGLQVLLKKSLGLESDLVLEGRIRRAENAAMRRLLQISALPKGGVDPRKYAGIILVDTQPDFTHTHPPGALPILAVIDHHQGPGPLEESGRKEAAAIPFVWVDSDYGATSTMIYDLLRAFEVELDERTATAVFCGVRYDTQNLASEHTDLDETAFLDLQAKADPKILAQIDEPPLSREYFQQMARAMDGCEYFGSVLITLLGEVSSPEAVAEIADWFLRLEGQQWSLAGGACDGRYQVSLRTDEPGADALPALRALIGPEGSCGGHGRMAGGQISLAERNLEEVRRLVRQRALEYFHLAGKQSEGLTGSRRNPGRKAAGIDSPRPVS